MKTRCQMNRDNTPFLLGRTLFSRIVAFSFVFFFAIAPMKAFAQCETAGPSNTAMDNLVSTEMDYINRFIIQEESFIDAVLSDTQLFEITDRLKAMSANIRGVLEEWWTEKFSPALKDMTAELHTSQLDQTRAIGNLTDARILVEEGNRRANEIINGRHRYAPSELACEIDSVGPGAAKAYQISTALGRGLILDDMPRRSNARGAASDVGTSKEQSLAWKEYVEKFCDNTMGDQGCTTPGTIAGKHKDIPAILWGSRQTIDPSNKDNLLSLQASLRYLVYPLVSDPVPKTFVDLPDGHLVILMRRAEEAFTNTIYNTMGRMLSERIGGSGVNAQLLRHNPAVPPADISTDASYRELQEVMTKDRYADPTYVVRMIEDPVQVAREQGTLNAIRLQTLNDMYRRSEELLFLEAAAYSRDLNMQMPKPGMSATRKR